MLKGSQLEGLTELLLSLDSYNLNRPRLPLESFVIYRNGDPAKAENMPNPEAKEYQEWLTESYPWPKDELYIDDDGKAYGFKNPHNLPRKEWRETFGTGKDHKGLRHVAGTRNRQKEFIATA